MVACIAFALPPPGRPWQRKNGAVSALDEGSLVRDGQIDTSAERGTRHIPDWDGAVFPWGQRLNQATTTTARADVPPTSSTPVKAVEAVRGETAHVQLHQQQQRPQLQQQQQQVQVQQQEPFSPLGCMFRPELSKERVVAVVSQVLCRPGFTLGTSDETRLLKSVRSGRIDIRTMSRILRWLAGDWATRELRRRGIEFVGPKQAPATAKATASSTPYTTGQGMTQLVKEVSQGCETSSLKGPILMVDSTAFSEKARPFFSRVMQRIACPVGPCVGL